MDESWRERREREVGTSRRRLFTGLGFLLLMVALVIAIVRGNRAEEALKRATAPHFDQEAMCATEEEDIFEAKREDFGNHPILVHFTPSERCWRKLVLPGFTNNWRIYTAKAEKRGDWVAVRCLDGRISFPPQSPNTSTPWGHCGGDTPKERNTFFFQGNVELVFKPE
jgi:hypothetical protein